MMGAVGPWEWCCALSGTAGRTSRKLKGSRMGLHVLFGMSLQCSGVAERS
jgi:hypothetical protein